MMKTRIISALCYCVPVIAILFFMDTPALPIFIALVSGIAVYELNNVAKVKLPLMILSIAVGAFIPFDVEYNLLDLVGITPLTALTAYFIIMLIMMIKWHASVKFEQVAMSLFASLAVPNAFACWIRLKDLQFAFDGKYAESHAVYLLLFAIFCSWFSDTFAYFVGVFLGKHKMAPVVSPKKTWEGAIGGIVLTAGVNVALYFIFRNRFFSIPFTDWEWYAVIPISILLSVVSIFGDLSASVIKRNYGVKDYGWIIPGHGGIMDRFDSIAFVLPTMYAIISIINTI